MSHHVRIQMATYNGADFLAEQLASFLAQKHDDWSLTVSDDGSTDGTRDILERFQARNRDREIQILDGPGRGSAANFLSILHRDKVPKGAYVALSDQDDIWMAHRLKRALAVMNTGGDATAQIYASRTALIDKDLSWRKLSKRHRFDPAFGNALVQNVLAGNTIVMNPAAAQIAAETAQTALRFVPPFHDWWLYLLLSGVGADMINDLRPGVLYRQHAGNVIGAHRGTGRALRRLGMIADKRYARWIDRNITALSRCGALLTSDNQETLDRFHTWRRQGGRYASLQSLKETGVWRQTGAGNAILVLMARSGWF
ncbi:MAG: glycosyltransferase [Rhodobacteraceae bacterium]|nr:glycosyltransferase [Paracoccaceae bacterium]